ncbi:hypothetical protein [Pseudonocardia sp. TRM90224]|uniref:hypothetical protein n=1 Tax=Pseudonocardia sp. TRM90224 TaxID=2812678 RepID=UPI001E6294AA|nr:hypothetical protein [Pseudonocardia sp. TRM90224]
MKRTGPLLTLLAVAVLGAALFVANRAGDPATAPPAPAAQATNAEAAPPQPPAEVPPEVPAEPAPAVEKLAYAGQTPGKELTIAIAVEAGKAVAYVCDGKKIEAWLEGEVKGSSVELKNSAGTSTVSGTVDEKKSTGTITVADKSWSYDAKAATPPSGLYEGRADVQGVANRVGWIVLEDGSQVGIRSANGVAQPAPPLNPADLGAVRIDGVPVTVTAIDGGDKVIKR